MSGPLPPRKKVYRSNGLRVISWAGSIVLERKGQKVAITPNELFRIAAWFWGDDLRREG
jgi:hypothetical protein